MNSDIFLEQDKVYWVYSTTEFYFFLLGYLYHKSGFWNLSDQINPELEALRKMYDDVRR